MNIKSFFVNLINSLLDGSFDRMRIINQMNKAFEESFYTGELDRMCKVSISMGHQPFAHEMSCLSFRSGFKISIENDSSLKESEIEELASYVTGNVAFVRQLMSLGFDTLIIRGKISGMNKMYALKKFANLSQYYIK